MDCVPPSRSIPVPSGLRPLSFKFHKTNEREKVDGLEEYKEYELINGIWFEIEPEWVLEQEYEAQVQAEKTNERKLS